MLQIPQLLWNRAAAKCLDKAVMLSSRHWLRANALMSENSSIA